MREAKSIRHQVDKNKNRFHKFPQHGLEFPTISQSICYIV